MSQLLPPEEVGVLHWGIRENKCFWFFLFFITIPNAIVSSFQRPLAEDTCHINIFFQISIIFVTDEKEGHRESYTSVNPIFGDVEISDFVITKITVDERGWSGSAPLHLYFRPSLQTVTRLHRDVQEGHFTVVVDVLHTLITASASASDVIKTELLYRPSVSNGEIRTGSTGRTLSEHELSMPPFAELTEIAITPEDANPHDFSLPYIRFSTEDFAVALWLPPDAKEGGDKYFQDNGVIEACTFNLRVGELLHQRTLPFPITKDVKIYYRGHGETTVITLSSLRSPLSKSDGYYDAPFPVIRDKSGNICNWNFPFIEFSILPELQLSESLGQLGRRTSTIHVPQQSGNWFNIINREPLRTASYPRVQGQDSRIIRSHVHYREARFPLYRILFKFYHRFYAYAQHCSSV